MKVLVVYYSLYGHIHAMAEAAAEGAREVAGVEAELRRVPETLTPDVLEKMGAVEAQKAMAHVPVATVDELGAADGLLFGTPTRFGNMAGQMRQFLDATGRLWAANALVGKPGGVFVSAGNQHGGLESTILSFQQSLMHHGMIIVGLPYTFTGQMGVDEIVGGSPYGASTIAAPDGSRMPSERDLAGARYQGRYLADIAARLAR